MIKRLLVVAFGVLAGLSGARAQVNVTYLDFEGRAFVTDNPTSATCQTNRINFGNSFTIVYRFTLNPALIADALAFITEHSDFHIVSTQSPSFSLNNLIVGGPSTTTYNYISSRAGSSGSIASSSNLNINRAFNGGGAPRLGTQNVVVLGTINDFLGVTGCTVTVHGALAARPD